MQIEKLAYFVYNQFGYLRQRQQLRAQGNNASAENVVRRGWCFHVPLITLYLKHLP